MAFGMGFLGQYAIGITKSIHELLTPEELRAVIAHEVGHIRSWDVGLMSALSFVVGGARQLAEFFIKGRSPLGRTPVGFALGLLCMLFGRIVFPVGIAAIQQERERAADALAALSVGSPDPLISGLKKLQAAMRRLIEEGKWPKRARGPFDDLFISHPEMDLRCAELEQLRG